MSSSDTSTLRPDTLAEQEICREALVEKYAKGDETSIAQVRRRGALSRYRRRSGVRRLTAAT